MRKHTDQMTKDEKGFIHGFVRANIERLNAGPQSHFYDRAHERTFSIAEAIEAVRCGLVIEVHNNNAPDVRVLVRDRKGTCAVVSLLTWNIIMVYYNDPTDTHYSLDWNKYRWVVNVVELVKGLRRKP